MTITETRTMSSVYMHWAKTHFTNPVRYGLTNSGLRNMTVAELGATLDDIELSGKSYYGYPPLLEALATHCGVPRECVVHATGPSMANYLALAAIVNPGDEVLIEQPAYEPITAAGMQVGAVVRRVPHEAALVGGVRRALAGHTRP